MDPLLHIFPYSFLRPPRLRLKPPSPTLPSAMAIYPAVLLYFTIISGIIYDVINEPPGMGSIIDHRTGKFIPVIFMPNNINDQYIIEGLSSGFMFVLGGIGIVFMDLALAPNRVKSVKISFAFMGISFVVISYVIIMLFVCIKIPAYVGCPFRSKIGNHGYDL